MAAVVQRGVECLVLVGLMGCPSVLGDPVSQESCGDPEVLRYLDADGDGFGNDAVAIRACDAPEGWVDQGGDCDDTQPSVHPGAAEVCDGRDNDCDAATLDRGLSFDDGNEVLDYAPLLASSSPLAPVRITLQEPGTLHVCDGTWFTGFLVEADVQVVGHGSPTIDGGGVLGAIVVRGPHRVDVSDLVLANPGAEGGSGGGLFCSDGGEIIGQRVTVLTSDAASIGGAGAIREDCLLTLSQSRFHGPAGVINSGHLLIAGARVEFTDVRFSGGLASAGGALAISATPEGPPSVVTCTNCIFEGNEASGASKGAAVLLSGAGSSLELRGSSFVDNVGDGTITIVLADETTSMTFADTMFAGNTGDPGSDIAVCDGADDCQRYYLPNQTEGWCDGLGCTIP